MQHKKRRQPSFGFMTPHSFIHSFISFLMHIPLWLILLVAIPAFRTEAFAAKGFGKTPPTKNGPTKQKRSLSPSRIVDAKSSNDNTNALVDKWGLPPPTVDDIFPPLPSETELKPALKTNYTLQEIQTCLKEYIDLQLHQSFDEQGMEILSSNTQQSKPMQLHLLHVSPPVLRIDHFLSPDECHELQQLATTSNKNDDKDCIRVESQTFPGAVSQRTSTSWFARYSAVPQFLAKTHYRLHIPLSRMEEPQIVRYRPQQLFSWHYDEVAPSALQNGGQRLMTLLVYLNTLQQSGGTMFRDLKSAQHEPLCVQPQQGSAILFFPAFQDGRPDDRTLHQGQAVSSGKEKWIVQMWIHQHDYQAALPPGNVQASAVGPMQQVARQYGYKNGVESSEW
jgi:prolyl 4-hydroxylase